MKQKRMQNEADDGHKGHDKDALLVMINIDHHVTHRVIIDGEECPVTTTDGMASSIHK